MGINLLDFWRFQDGKRKLSLRKLMLFVNKLPPDSLVIKKLAGAQAEWDLKEYMLADIIDSLQESNWMFRQQYSKSKLKPPKPVPRPGYQPKKKARKKVTKNDLALLKLR